MKIILLAAFLASLSLHAQAQFNANCQGTRTTIVHLFEWRWVDIALECERFLGPKGYCGVQVSPPNENRVVMYDTEKRPWWERYQPVSYKIATRSGDEAAFVDMVSRCNNVGVRIYVDAVINHMARGDASASTGTGGTAFNSAALSFPGVPYSSLDFHNQCLITNYQDAFHVRYCRLDDLVDLDHSKDWVRQKIAEYLNRLIGWGVAGFRIDAAKHMSPNDLQAIYGMLQNLKTPLFPANTKPFIYQEVIESAGEPIKASEYYGMARVSEFLYGKYLSKMFTNNDLLKWLRTFGEGWGYMMPSDKALVFIDNHDNQRGHGAGGAILNFFSPRQYKMAVTFMLAWPYGQAQVMSSYRWSRNFVNGIDLNNWVGPPRDGNYNTLPVTVNADDTCGNDWVCEHRWRQIYNMAKFRNLAGTETVQNWWDDGENQIAFSRGNKGFYAVNSGSKVMSQVLVTGMAPGRYCDIISGNKNADQISCTGKVIVVGSDGKASIYISNTDEDPMIAIHTDSMLASNFQRTVVFIKYQSQMGQDMFIRGGIDYGRRTICNTFSSACVLPIRYNHVSYSSSGYIPYNTWAQGDRYLDWLGAEQGQSSYNGKQPEGSPLAWTTWSSGSASYNSMNSFGEHYWMLDVNMDCNAADRGWFELKGIVNGQWESNINQNTASCSGNVGGSSPFSSGNHIARCGYKNVFIWNQPSCQVDNI